MSHRVTTETEIKDKGLALQALKQAGFSYREVSPDTLTITSGPMTHASLNLTTGTVSGDTDHGHSRDSLGVLKQFYGEAKYRAECLKQGIQIESRQLDKQGNIVLMCAMA